MSLLTLLILAQNLNLNVQPIEVRQNGVKVPSVQRQYVIDCRTGMTCTVDGGIAFLSSSGGGGGGSTPSVSCSIDQALTWDGVSWACLSKIRAAYMADSGIFAQVANVAYSADASVFAVEATTARVAYSADASYLSSVATVARSAYEADASVFAVVATSAGTAFSADASVFAVVATTAGIAYSADASYLSSVATIARSAYEADASVFAKQFQTDPTDCAGGQFATAIDVLGNLTCSTPSGSGGKVAEAYMADASISAQYLTLTCSAGQFVTCAGTSCSCATPSGGGGGGSANYSSGTATFSGKSDTLTTITAAWAGTTSSIICSADGEESSVEAAQHVVTTKSAGSFIVRSYVLQGRHTGALPFTCTGL